MEEKKEIKLPKELTRLRRRHGSPTLKQIKALQYRNQGLSVRQSLLKAGYSINVANKSTHFFTMKGVRNALISYKDYFERNGLTPENWAEKFAEWKEAKKTISIKDGEKEVPDYDTQIKAYDRYKKVIDEIEGVGENKVKRKLTIEEFISDDSYPFQGGTEK